MSKSDIEFRDCDRASGMESSSDAGDSYIHIPMCGDASLGFRELSIGSCDANRDSHSSETQNGSDKRLDGELSYKGLKMEEAAVLDKIKNLVHENEQLKVILLKHNDMLQKYYDDLEDLQQKFVDSRDRSKEEHAKQIYKLESELNHYKEIIKLKKNDRDSDDPVIVNFEEERKQLENLLKVIMQKIGGLSSSEPMIDSSLKEVGLGADLASLHKSLRKCLETSFTEQCMLVPSTREQFGEILQLKERCELFETELEESRLRIEHLREIETEKKVLEKTLEEVERNKKDLVFQNEKLKKTIQALHRRIDELEKEQPSVEIMHVDLTESKKGNEELKGHLEEERQKCEELAIVHMVASEQSKVVDELKKQLEEERQKCEQLAILHMASSEQSAEVSELKVELEEENRECEGLVVLPSHDQSKEVDELKVKLEEERKKSERLASLQMVSSDQSKELDELKRQLEAERQKCEQLAILHMASDQTKEVDELKEQLEEERRKCERLANLQMASSAQSKEVDELRLQVEEERKKCERLAIFHMTSNDQSKVIEELRAQLDRERNKSDRLAEQLSFLQNRGQEIVQHIDRITAENTGLRHVLQLTEENKKKDAAKVEDLQTSYEMRLATVSEELTISKNELVKRMQELNAERGKVEKLVDEVSKEKKVPLHTFGICEDNRKADSTPQKETDNIERLKKEIDLLKRREGKDADRINELIEEKNKLRHEIESQKKTIQKLQDRLEEMMCQDRDELIPPVIICNWCGKQVDIEKRSIMSLTSITRGRNEPISLQQVVPQSSVSMNIVGGSFESRADDEVHSRRGGDSQELHNLRRELDQIRLKFSEAVDSLDKTKAEHEALKINFQKLLKEKEFLDQKNLCLNEINDEWKDSKGRIANVQETLKAMDEKLSQKELELEKLYCLRNEDAVVIERLQDQVRTLKKTNEQSKKQHEQDQSLLREVSTGFEALQRNHQNLLRDYNHLWNCYNSKLHQVAANEQQKSRTYLEEIQKLTARVASAQENEDQKSRKYLDQIEKLTAKVATAEEVISEKDEKLKNVEQIAKLHEEKVKQMEGEVETVPILHEQVAVYESDFKAEREARERQHSEIVKLREALENLQLENSRLQDELESRNTAQMEEMRRRHGNSFSRGSTSFQWIPVGPTAYSPYASQSRHTNVYGRGPNVDSGVPVMPTNARGQQRDIRDSSSVDRRTGQASHGQDVNQTVQSLCPKCKVHFPDLDTLQIHVMDCIDDE